MSELLSVRAVFKYRKVAERNVFDFYPSSGITYNALDIRVVHQWGVYFIGHIVTPEAIATGWINPKEIIEIMDYADSRSMKD